MTHWLASSFLFLQLAFCTVALVACANPTVSLATEQQARDAAWAALEPNTSSHTRANWEVVQVKQVTGQEVASKFDGQPSVGCWMRPTPTPNKAISSAGNYWYAELKPRPATPVPQKRTVSPTEPPAVPEPFLRQAQFLLDAANAQVVARKLFCVIY